MRRRYSHAYNTAPRFITAKYAGVCAETGIEIKVGDKILYHPEGRKVFCEKSKTYTDFASAEFDRTVLGREY
jgi:hypothetical protein